MADEDADHYDDIKKGIAAIKSLIESEDPNSKNVRTKALRADLEKAISPDALKDPTSASLAKFKTGIEQANKLLKGYLELRECRTICNRPITFQQLPTLLFRHRQ